MRERDCDCESISEGFDEEDTDRADEQPPTCCAAPAAPPKSNGICSGDPSPAAQLDGRSTTPEAASETTDAFESRLVFVRRLFKPLADR